MIVVGGVLARRQKAAYIAAAVFLLNGLTKGGRKYLINIA